MAVHPIRYLGDPVLRNRAKKVTRIDGSIERLFDDMLESMHAARGVGLAAPQIGIPLRLIVIQTDPEDEPIFLANPEIVKVQGVRYLDEGCLSVPGYRGSIPRSTKVVAKGMDRSGKSVRIRAEDDLLAEALEHEIDHVNGVLYIDHLEKREDLVKIEPEDEAELDGEPEGDEEAAG
ncbi:MAG: peptide deformylase [Dehalococcoidia bacterium]|nr:peptide deformylase [Dehalococcoidia bacterium]